MGQLQTPAPPPSIILTAVDRLVASNADGGLSPLAEHIILFGEDAGKNLGDVDDIIVLGAFGLDAGLGDVRLVGTIGIGRNVFSALTTGTNNSDATGGNVGIGRNVGALAQFMTNCVVVGCEALANMVGSTVNSGPERSVIIGNEAVERIAGSSQFTGNVMIGWRVFRGPVTLPTTVAANANVFVGDQIARDAVIGLISNTVVGAAAGVGLASGGLNPPQSNVVVGASGATFLVNGAQNVYVGSITGPGAGGVGEQDRAVAVGFNINCYGPKHTIIGTQAVANQGFGVVGSHSIIIGYQAGVTMANNLSHVVAIETFETSGAVQRGALYGYMDTGSIILGKSQQGVDRPTVANFGTQNVKLLNGTQAAAAPVGGGQFFVVGGELFWHSSAGNVIPLSNSVGFTVATLPAAPSQGSRAYVTDALAPAFLAAVVGGGAVVTPVFFDGAAWVAG